jgi:hypothetical protein
MLISMYATGYQTIQHSPSKTSARNGRSFKNGACGCGRFMRSVVRLKEGVFEYKEQARVGEPQTLETRVLAMPDL